MSLVIGTVHRGPIYKRIDEEYENDGFQLCVHGKAHGNTIFTYCN